MDGTNKQGIGQLFPFNAFINAEDYFRRRFCGSSFETSFENCFLLGYNIVAILALLLALRSVRNYHAQLLDDSVVCSVLCQVARFSVGNGRDVRPRNILYIIVSVADFDKPLMLFLALLTVQFHLARDAPSIVAFDMKVPTTC